MAHCYRQIQVTTEDAAGNIEGASVDGSALLGYRAGRRLAEDFSGEEQVASGRFIVSFGGLAMGHHWAVVWLQSARRSLLSDVGLLL